MALNGPKATKKDELTSVSQLADRVFRQGWQTTMAGIGRLARTGSKTTTRKGMPLVLSRRIVDR